MPGSHLPGTEMNAIRSSSRCASAALLLLSFVCAGSAFAASFEDAMRILNQLKSVMPPAAPAAPPANTPAPASGSASPVQSGTPAAFGHNNRFSDAEKAYVPAQATTRVAEGPRSAKVEPSFGRKLVTPGHEVTITNPYLDVQQVFFATIVEMHYAPDGALIVAGRVGLDKEMHAIGTGYWRIAPDGAVTPLHTRSTKTYGKSPATLCDAHYTRSHLKPENFSPGLNGAIVKTTDYAVLRIEADGNVRRLAGSPFACEGGTRAQLEGFVDGPADTARFNGLSNVVSDPDGNIWVIDQKGCALRRVAPDGHVTTVLTPEKVLCGNSDVAAEDRVGLHELAWDAANGELVSSASFPVARPVHTLYNTVWRIRPNGEFRRVLWSKKGGVSPSKVHMDGIWSLAVDPQGRIHLGSKLLIPRTSSPLAVVRVDEARATAVAVTGAAYGPGTFGQGHDQPLDGPAARAKFHWVKGLAFAPDGTLYIRDEHLVRRLDRSGQVTTWVF